MKLKKNVHSSDVLTLTPKDWEVLQERKTLVLPGLVVELAKDDVVVHAYVARESNELYVSQSPAWEPNVEFIFEAESGYLKSAQIINR